MLELRGALFVFLVEMRALVDPKIRTPVVISNAGSREGKFVCRVRSPVLWRVDDNACETASIASPASHLDCMPGARLDVLNALAWVPVILVSIPVDAAKLIFAYPLTFFHQVTELALKVIRTPRFRKGATELVVALGQSEEVS